MYRADNTTTTTTTTTNTNAMELSSPSTTEHSSTHSVHPFKKKHIPHTPKVKDKEQMPWHIEDSEGNYAYDGTKEGGMTSSYVLLVYENQAFHVIPCGEWYNFKPKRTYQTLSIEEAEAQMHNTRLRLERSVQKMNQHANASTPSQSEEAGGSAAGGKRDKEDEEFLTLDEEDEEKFSEWAKDEEKKPKQKVPKGKKKATSGEGREEAEDEKEAEGEKDEDEPDWKDFFDDDEEEQSPEDEEEPNAIREKGVEDETDDSLLTDAGKEIRNLLKNHKNEEEASDASDFLDSDTGDDDDEDFDEDDLPDVRFPKLSNSAPTNINPDERMKDNVGDSSSPTSPLPSSLENDKKGKSKRNSKGKTKDSTKKEAKSKDAKPKKARTPIANTGDGPVSTAPSTTKSSSKRAAESSGSNGPLFKKPKIENQPLENPRVTEDEVRRILSNGGLPTLDFIKHFRATFTANPAEKAKLTALTTKLCRKDEKGLLVLKN